VDVSPCPLGHNTPLPLKRSPPASSSRTSFGHFTPELQGGDCLIARDTREVVQELIEGVTPLEVVVESLHRHARANEDGSPSEDLRVAMNDLGFFIA